MRDTINLIPFMKLSTEHNDETGRKILDRMIELSALYISYEQYGNRIIKGLNILYDDLACPHCGQVSGLQVLYKVCDILAQEGEYGDHTMCSDVCNPKELTLSQISDWVKTYDNDARSIDTIIRCKQCDSILDL